ncbi:MAG: cell division topological specificity factor MinE [Candidatus Obscuribacterales bacterium]|nr:cell division topological specificity factor MinE [Candidatus Obscuribacterales bacterium]
MQVLNWFFRTKGDDVRTRAKDRMRLMLIHDRLELPPDRLASLEEELIAVVSRYFEIDRDTTRFDLQQYERRAALVANFPLLRSKS